MQSTMFTFVSVLFVYIYATMHNLIISGNSIGNANFKHNYTILVAIMLQKEMHQIDEGFDRGKRYEKILNTLSTPNTLLS